MYGDYYIEYLNSKLAFFEMIREFYKHKISVSEALKYGMDLSEVDILCDNDIDCYFHKFEYNGEYIWKILELDTPIISEKELNMKQDEIKKELLNLTQTTQNKITRLTKKSKKIM